MLTANLPVLQKKLPANTVTLFPISGADMLYTDGLASAYQYRLEIKEGGSVKYSAYINTKEFVSCNLSKSEETTYYGNIVQSWINGLTQTTLPNPSPRQNHT
jgi:hypothetical protein